MFKCICCLPEESIPTRHALRSLVVTYGTVPVKRAVLLQIELKLQVKNLICVLVFLSCSLRRKEGDEKALSSLIKFKITRLQIRHRFVNNAITSGVPPMKHPLSCISLRRPSSFELQVDISSPSIVQGWPASAWGKVFADPGQMSRAPSCCWTGSKADPGTRPEDLEPSLQHCDEESQVRRLLT